jgi:hypothetical protein
MESGQLYITIPPKNHNKHNIFTTASVSEYQHLFLAKLDYYNTASRCENANTLVKPYG